MAEDTTSLLRKRADRERSVLRPTPEGPVPGELASELLRNEVPELAMEMPRLEAALEGRGGLEPLRAPLRDLVPFGERRAFKRAPRVGMSVDE